jgi:hypothetical protein
MLLPLSTEMEGVLEASLLEPSLLEVEPLVAPAPTTLLLL